MTNKVITSTNEMTAWVWMKRVFLGALVFFSIWLSIYAWNIISTSGPVAYREGAVILLTDYILHGKNPFVLMNQPLMNTNKGAFYNLLVVPFAALFGNSLTLHRIISMIFIGLSSFLVIWCLRKLNREWTLAISGGLLVVAGLLFYVSPTARADGLGTFLYLLSVIFPFLNDFDRKSLIISAIAGILAFFTKPYFFLSFAIISLYIFLFISKRKALIFGFLTIVALVLISLLVRRFFPCYFLNTILNNASNEANHLDFLFKQLAVFAGVFAPLILIFFLTNPIKLDSPFLNESFDFFIFFFLVAAAAIFVLGQNTGNYMVYLFQLMAPPLVILALKKVEISGNIRNLLSLLLIVVNLGILCFYMLYPNTPPPADQWKEINQLLSQSKKVLNSPVLVPEMVNLGLQPIDSGSSEYYYRTQPYIGNLLAPLYSATKMRGDDYLYEVENTIREKGFDKIIITKGYSPFAKLDLIQQYYRHVRDFHIEMPQSKESWDLEYWEPIT